MLYPVFGDIDEQLLNEGTTYDFDEIHIRIVNTYFMKNNKKTILFSLNFESNKVFIEYCNKYNIPLKIIDNRKKEEK